MAEDIAVKRMRSSYAVHIGGILPFLTLTAEKWETWEMEGN